MARITWVLPFLIALPGCAHMLEVTNLEDYSVPAIITEPTKVVNVQVSSRQGGEHVLYTNAVITGLSARREFDKFSSTAPGARTTFEPDFMLTIDAAIEYSSSGSNFFVNFPGGIVFAPAWAGYGYSADITTTVTICNAAGKQLDELVIETPYAIRHSSFDRTWYPIFSFNILNPIGGIYTALVYDSDITPHVQVAVEKNYAEYITHQIVNALDVLGTGRP
jgi:hypothetical protein